MIPKTVVVTGANGFIGKNLVTRLKRENFHVLTLEHNAIDQIAVKTLNQADVVFHLAGVNRPVYQTEFDSGNHEFTKRVVDILRHYGRNPTIIYASSTQIYDILTNNSSINEYALSKLNAEAVLNLWAKESNSTITVFRLPNVYGKWSKPNYNSVVATFCQNLIDEKALVVHQESKVIELVHVDDVVNLFIEEIPNPSKKFQIVDVPCKITNFIQVGSLKEELEKIHEQHNKSIIPNMKNTFTKKLYSTYISFLNTENELVSKGEVDHKDDRGTLKELLKSNETGQIFVSTTKPGITRGGHYHNQKFEKFIVLSGEAMITIEDVITEELKIINVSGHEMKTVNIPPGTRHWIKNVGDDMLITLFWANEIFDPLNTDTYE